MDDKPQDVLIIGGGPAGLTAALYLGRARKSVLVIDGGHPRHAVSEGVHNFLTRDGLPPAALRETAWRQMEAYPSVAHRKTAVTALARQGDLWAARTADGARQTGRAVLLATGVIDEHPEWPGFEERWGHSIHHCPYCHGWELREAPLAVLAHGEAAGHLALLLRGWSGDVVLLSDGGPIAQETRERIESAGIAIFEAPVESLEGPGRELSHIHLTDGTTLERRGLFVKSPQRQVPLVQAIGLRLDEEGYVDVDPFGTTSLPGVWAAGDLTSRLQQVVEAAAQGARAAATINAALTVG